MPITYPEGIVNEYNNVRNSSGLFDVSHMGQIFIEGKLASDFVQKIITNDISSIEPGQALYTVMCNIDGGIIDDLIVYQLSESRYMMIVNASNIEKDFLWLSSSNDMNLNITNESDNYSLIALQGPDSYRIIREVFQMFPAQLDFFNHISFNSDYGQIFVSRTGYTGEHGYEIMVDNSNALDLWKRFLALDVNACGLASRDILRLEMCYCLYGNDINDKTTPTSANLGWVTKLNKKDFIGREAIINNNSKDLLVPFKLSDRGIPRKGYKIISNDEQIGLVTSGAHSPVLSQGIGMGYIDKRYINSNEQIYVDIRGSLIPIEIIKGAFIKGTSLLANE